MLNRKNQKTIFLAFIVAFTILLAGTTVFADEWPTIENPSSNNDSNIEFYDDEVIDMDDPTSKHTREEKAMLDKDFTHIYEDQLPEVTIDDAFEFIYRKGYDVIRALQVLAQPVSILFFIFSAIIMLFGIFGRGDKLSKGLTGMIISGFVYVAILYAPTILKAIVSFFTS